MVDEKLDHNQNRHEERAMEEGESSSSAPRCRLGRCLRGLFALLGGHLRLFLDIHDEHRSDNFQLCWTLRGRKTEEVQGSVTEYPLSIALVAGSRRLPCLVP